jgi:flagellar basal body rod protein FlgB
MIDFDRDTAFTQRVLDALTARANATMKNIANRNTAGFKRYEVRFEDYLRQAAGEGRDLASVEPKVMRDESGDPGINNVVLMDELALLGKTALLHDVMARRMGSYARKMNKAIFGR